MTKYKIPLTRQNYLDLAYFGDVPKELSAEQELELPERFRAGLETRPNEQEPRFRAGPETRQADDSYKGKMPKSKPQAVKEKAPSGVTFDTSGTM